MNKTFLLCVQSIRSQSPFGRGGCVFTATRIDGNGHVSDAKSYFVVKASGAQLGEACVQRGQWWTVTGPIQTYSRTNGSYVVSELQITAEEISLARPSGEHIVSFLCTCNDFRGIGSVKAGRLWNTFGERLYEILDEADVEALSTVLTPESAQNAVAAWSKQSGIRTLQLLQTSGIEKSVGRQLLTFYGNETYERLTEDPYRLLSFSASWKLVDSLAQSRFNVQVDDPRRLQAALEEALYRIFERGDTVSPISDLIMRVRTILEDSAPVALVMAALESGLTNGSYVIGDNGTVHLLGSLIMEKTVAKAIADRILRKAILVTSEILDELLYMYERSEGIVLNIEQRDAVRCANSHAVALIVGGAGVGKTTVLKAIHAVYDCADIRIAQVALSGRAAQRMFEATGRPATTLASFFINYIDEDFSGPSVVVIDEASMVDIITMHRLCELLPSHTRLLLVGDIGQLMPVGPGLVLHALSELELLPKVELKQVKRYGSAIAAAALDIRNGRWPDLPVDGESPISFVPCTLSEIAELVPLLYEQDRQNTQILTARKRNVDGTKSLNELCQSRLSSKIPLVVYNTEYQCDVRTGFYLGDPILCTKNLWDWGLQNGSLGTLEEIERRPRLLRKPDGSELGYTLAWIRWDDGVRRPVLEWMLDYFELGYAITIHKAQGSQWQRIIVALTRNRLLDRTLLYTAVTRAQNQVIIVGDVAAARAATEALPRANRRQVALGIILRNSLCGSLDTITEIASRN